MAKRSLCVTMHAPLATKRSEYTGKKRGCQTAVVIRLKPPCNFFCINLFTLPEGLRGAAPGASFGGRVRAAPKGFGICKHRRLQVPALPRARPERSTQARDGARRSCAARVRSRPLSPWPMMTTWPLRSGSSGRKPMTVGSSSERGEKKDLAAENDSGTTRRPVTSSVPRLSVLSGTARRTSLASGR